jgi:uncharacterized FlgJ-related protein
MPQRLTLCIKKARKSISDIVVDQLRAEMLLLTRRLKDKKEKAFMYQKAIVESKEQRRSLQELIHSSQMAAQFSNQEMRRWKEIAKIYRLKCVQNSETLGHIASFIERQPSFGQRLFQN